MRRTNNGEDHPIIYPPVVFVHGFAQSAKTWEEITCRFRERMPQTALYTFELAGHGGGACELTEREEGACELVEHTSGAEQSDKAEPKDNAKQLSGEEQSSTVHYSGYARTEKSDPYALAVQAEALLQFCASLPHPPLLVGYSMGGRVALSALALYTRNESGNAYSPYTQKHNNPRSTLAFCGLVLESAGLGPADAKSRAAVKMRNEAWAAQLRALGIEHFMDMWEDLVLFKTQKSLPEETRARVRSERLCNNAEVLAATLDQAGEHAMLGRKDIYEALNRASRLGIPLVYIAGECDEKYVGIARELTQNGVDARVHIIPSSGHNVHLENPEIFLDVLCQAYLLVIS